MSQKPDDLEAVRTICTALEPFDESERLQIIRWACERLGIKFAAATPSPGQTFQTPPATGSTPLTGVHEGAKDIKSFLNEKSPNSANQLVAAVAYYHKFEAPATERKNAITKDDLLDACRKSQRERPKFPNQVMVNASAFGLVDKVDTGTYEINAVGENLVAVSMPTTGHGNSGVKKSAKGKRKNKK